MRLPRALVDPFQAVACRIGYIGPVMLHAPLYREPSHYARVFWTPEAWARVNVCRYCGETLQDRDRRRSS